MMNICQCSAGPMMCDSSGSHPSPVPAHLVYFLPQIFSGCLPTKWGAPCDFRLLSWQQGKETWLFLSQAFFLAWKLSQNCMKWTLMTNMSINFTVFCVKHLKKELSAWDFFSEKPITEWKNICIRNF